MERIAVNRIQVHEVEEMEERDGDDSRTKRYTPAIIIVDECSSDDTGIRADIA